MAVFVVKLQLKLADWLSAPPVHTGAVFSLGRLSRAGTQAGQRPAQKPRRSGSCGPSAGGFWKHFRQSIHQHAN